MGQETNPARNAEALQVAEKIARIVDEYVMDITEGLCSLENRNCGGKLLPKIGSLKVRTLENLDRLDRLMSDYRNDVARHDMIPPVPIGKRRA